MSWVSGDILTSKNLNDKTAQIANSSKRFRGNSDQGKSISTSPDLVFRQESSEMPAVGEEFPWYYARKSFRILGVRAYFSGGGTFTVNLITDSDIVTDEVTVQYDDVASTAGVTRHPELTVRTELNSGDRVKLKVIEMAGTIENFQFNVLTRVLS